MDPIKLALRVEALFVWEGDPEGLVEVEVELDLAPEELLLAPPEVVTVGEEPPEL